MNKEILKLINEKGLLLEKEIFDVLDGVKDINLAAVFLESLEKIAGNKMITSSTIIKNFGYEYRDPGIYLCRPSSGWGYWNY